MNETWLTILNEIINSETNEVNVEVKQYHTSIKLRVDKYHHYLHDYSKLDRIMGIMINLENILDYSVTEIQDDDSTTYIIKKDSIKNIKCNSNFLYDNNDIIPDRIDCEYTGYFNLKKTSATLQTIMFVTAGHKVCINISYITNKPFAIAEIDIDDHKRNILYEKISGVGKEIKLAELKDLTDNELIIRKVTDLITIYTIYM